MKYLVVGLGNIGSKYENTRHNIGFKILDELANSLGIFFEENKYAFVTEFKYKGKKIILVKPTTFMNLSGKAVNYWMQIKKIPLDKTLIITDDIHLPFGKIRIRGKGSDGGHNGLKDIQNTLNTNQYLRLRFGIGNQFFTGQQVNYVLGEWNSDELKTLSQLIKKCKEAVFSFITIGFERTMNQFNTK